MRKAISNRLLAISLYSALGLFLLAACAPKYSVISDEAKSSVVSSEERELIFKSGFEEGKKLSREEFLKAFTEELEKLKGLVLYEEMKKDGYFSPPIIVPVIGGGGVSEDGKTFSSPWIEWVIVEDAKFKKDDFLKSIMRVKHYVFLGIFESYSEAEGFVNKVTLLSKDDTFRFMKVKNSKSIAIVIETPYRENSDKYAGSYGGMVIEGKGQ